MKKALITGITGQDGAYLAEFLLKKGYEVHGIKRRASSFNTGRVDHLYKDVHEKEVRFFMHYGDLTDSTNLIRIIQMVQPDEIYNLAAQSHVKVSFETPEYTANSDALGTLRILEAIRILGLEKKTRFYQASTSEMYGKVQEIPQKETTPFYPRSPYGAAKVYAYWITVNYREAYGMFACNGLLFNHETVADFMPMIFKIGENGKIDIKPISEIVKYHTIEDKISINEDKKEYQAGTVETDLYVWDADGWTKVRHFSAYPHDIKNDNKKPLMVNSRNSCFVATSEHVVIMKDKREKKVGDLAIGDRVNLIEYPTDYGKYDEITLKEAELLGFIVGDGYHNRKSNLLRLVGKDLDKLKYFADIWEKTLNGECSYRQVPSGFNKESLVWQVNLIKNKKWIKQFSIYDEYGKKRIPYQVLNSSEEIKLSFLRGYYRADGLNSKHCRYEFSNIKTNSATLAAGLIFLLKELTNQDYNITVEERIRESGKRSFYYSVNLLSNSDKGNNHRNSADKRDMVLEILESGNSQRGIQRETGISRTFIRKVQNGYNPSGNHHLSKDKDEIKKLIDFSDYDGWFYDLETESGTFHTGMGQGHLHNSPIRGETFVTRKITRAVARIKLGLQEDIYLGNLDSKRDWGFAPDYVRGMWMMLQADEPDDFVIATGESHSVREFVEKAFEEIGIELIWEGSGVDEIGKDAATGKILVRIDSRYFRPTEVEFLLGDPSKAKEKLGWEPKVSFHELVKIMVRDDLKEAARDQLCRKEGFPTYNHFE